MPYCSKSHKIQTNKYKKHKLSTEIVAPRCSIPPGLDKAIELFHELIPETEVVAVSAVKLPTVVGRRELCGEPPSAAE